MMFGDSSSNFHRMWWWNIVKQIRNHSQYGGSIVLIGFTMSLMTPKKMTLIEFTITNNKSLVGGAITILKNDGVRQWVSDDIPYIKWKITAMFETTNSSHSLPLHILNDMVNPMSLMKFTLLPRSSTGAQSSVQHIDFTESPLSSIDNSLGLSAALGRVTAAETWTPQR